MSNYTSAPPSYQAVSPSKARDPEAAQPLFSPRAGPSGGAYFDQPEVGDLPDDFKVSTPSRLAIDALTHLVVVLLVWYLCRR